MAVTERGGARIWYEDRHGRQPEGRDAGGPPVLLVHGGLHERMDAGRFWVVPGVAGAVAEAAHRLLVPDRRWSGGATIAAVREHTWALEADDLAAVLRHSAGAPALVVAGSNGCSAALRLALDRPELVAGLVLAWPPRREDPWLEQAFERSAALVASAGTRAYVDAVRSHGVPGWREPRPGLAFGVALTLDPLARESFERLDAAEGASLLRRSGRSLLAGETVRGATDRELRSLAAAHLGVRVIAPASDGLTHSRAVAERLAGLTGAEPPAAGFPETPRPDFAAAREPFQTALLGLLASMGRRERPWGPEATPPRTDALRPTTSPGAAPPTTASGR